MKNYKLILLKDGRNILVSDEGSKKGEWIIHANTINEVIKSFNEPKIAEYDYASNSLYNFKVIAGIESLPTLTYSDKVAKELKNKYNWVDIEEIMKQVTDKKAEVNNKIDLDAYYLGMFDFFKAYQSITNKMFSLEHIEKAMIEGLTIEKFWERCIQSLQQPIQLEVEIEMEDSKIVEKYEFDGSNDGEITWEKQPKITNNSITITKIL